jgi:hypothetical protein
MNVPPIYHFIFSLTRSAREKPFSLIHYLAIASCAAVNRPEQINFYCKYEPTGIWWQRARPFVTVVQVEPPTAIFGHTLTRPEHISDVLRLEILLDRGGVYLDVDVISVRPFAPLMRGSMNREVVLGVERGVGLCNAVILAPPAAPFLAAWQREYRCFNPAKWNEHSVALPRRLSLEHPDTVRVLDEYKFFWPMYYPEHERAFFLRPGSDFCRESYCVHLWESVLWHLLKLMTVRYVIGVESEFCQLARPYIDPSWLDDDGAASLDADVRLADLVAWRTALAALPPQCQEAVVLHDLLGCDVTETAALLECAEEELAPRLAVGRTIAAGTTAIGTASSLTPQFP